MDKQLLIAEARSFLARGVSVTPIHGKLPWMSTRDGEVTWAAYREQHIDDATLVRLCEHRKTTGVALLTGATSGNLEILDFDFKLGMLWFDRWLDLVGPTAIQGLPIVETGGGGLQVAYHCDEIAPRQCLAYAASGNPKEPWKLLIETRGEGNLAVVPPSIHPESKLAYRYRTGHFAEAPRIPIELRTRFLTASRTLDEKAKHEAVQRAAEAARRDRRPPTPGWQTAQGASIVDAFNAQEDIEHWLEQHRFTVHGTYAIRPDGKRRNTKIRDNKSFHNSTSDPFCDGHWKTPFELMLQHPSHGGGDFKRALAYASERTGIPLMSYTYPPVRQEPMAPPPALPPPPDRTAVVLIMDDAESAECLRAMGQAVVLASREGDYLAELRQAVAPYARRIVVLQPPNDGSAEALAADLDASVVELPTTVTAMIAEGALGLITLIAQLRGAAEPIYRLGHKLGRRRQ